MKKSLILVLSALMLINVSDAFSLSFMDTPYTYLDEYTMTLWKPLIQLVLIDWATNIVCGSFASLITDALSMSNSMTDAEQTTYCNDGITTYVDLMFYGGGTENKPATASWKWSPSDDFA